MHLKMNYQKKYLTRKKHGFEIPLNKWFKNELQSFIDDEIFENNMAVKEGILSKKWS